ncbi:MAG: AAA family ATPase, partial [Spirochaetaceae bacterium]|nr:AAA family ATPase [Spirochaetaceae bacterium]
SYPHFSYRPSGWDTDLPLTHASSMVSELAPGGLYLRQVVAPTDLLIIDEPESHLHPAMQVAFTRQVASIVRAGVRVIVTTHSEWVLEELGNVVGRDRLADGGADSPNAVSLSARDIGVWLFQPAPDGSGSTATELTMDEESGLYPSGFDAVARQLHNDWARLPVPRGREE